MANIFKQIKDTITDPFGTKRSTIALEDLRKDGHNIDTEIAKGSGHAIYSYVK